MSKLSDMIREERKALAAARDLAVQRKLRTFREALTHTGMGAEQITDLTTKYECMLRNGGNNDG